MSSSKGTDADKINGMTGPISTAHETISTQLSIDTSAELPFLVTHWLSRYSPSPSSTSGGSQNDARRQALERIRHAASDLASAFSTLGAFGTANMPSLVMESGMTVEQLPSRKASFADWKRRWSNCSPHQLEYLMKAAAVSASTADELVQQNSPVDVLYASLERLQATNRNPENGRTLNDVIELDQVEPINIKKIGSSLQPTILLDAGLNKGLTKESSLAEGGRETISLNLVSAHKNKSYHAASCVRQFLDLRDKFVNENAHISSIKKSIAFQETSLLHLLQQRASLLQTNPDIETTSKLVLFDDIKDEELNSNRVLAQLKRQLDSLQPSLVATSNDLFRANSLARQAFIDAKTFFQRYRDPKFGKVSLEPGSVANRILFNLTARQTGLDRRLGCNTPRSMGRMCPHGSTLETRQAIFISRLSHAVTINTHLAYPVYCLRFDRTGCYFITGADDYLVKVFCLGQYARGKREVDPASYARGAILVCTLRGHAGVINDIDVSSDNSFLATASEDGDCRIWGLKDGCPIAILRGHKGGANMVSWSALTPYRLVTAGADGLARIWDVRQACLKRYGKVIGKRSEYRSTLQNNTDDEVNIGRSKPAGPSNSATQADAFQDADAQVSPHVQISVPVPAPPLPPPPDIPSASQGVAAVVNPHLSNVIQIGAFIANDTIDQGVQLLSKLQHGASITDQHAGPGTRSRRSTVKVICVARCPHGGHFATGSDDGICRLWRDNDDSAVILTDDNAHQMSRYRPLPSTDAHLNFTEGALLTLKGHLSAITDLQYSFAGDRLLTASQKDGVVRIWSWSVDPCVSGTSKGTSAKLSHILIKLVNPNSRLNASSVNPRRGPNKSSLPLSVTCDVAAWIRDDTKIVTSQCELLKQTGAEIVPGSQLLCIWDSVTGHCLVAINGAHNMQCPVVVSHPFDPAILCTAGADGVVKVWNLHSGKSFYTYKNTLPYDLEASWDCEKVAGFLDGTFYPDGTGLVLTDDNGRVIILDCLNLNVKKYKSFDLTMAWMKEQYFANDYYELFYDVNGYCIERGSEQPPHLAPVGVRCSHGGVPWSSIVNEAFKGLTGPSPLSENESRWRRRQIRLLGHSARQRHFDVKGNTVQQCDLSTTFLVDGQGISTSLYPRVHTEPHVSRSRRVDSSNPGTMHLSSNYRWRDYNDVLHETANDDDDPESDDEEFELVERRSPRQSSVIDDTDDSLDIAENIEEFTPDRPAKRRLKPSPGTESDVDSDDFTEIVSTNNEPSGPFMSDYVEHCFKIPRNATVYRDWLRRLDSDSSYDGRKSYTPQVGDEVVYIPRAHRETLTAFPSLHPPWQSWPQNAVWPIARCCIQYIRYRFPYKSYFTQRTSSLRSVVAILTLEVTGVPDPSLDTNLDWPSPSSFRKPLQKHIFELALFECSDRRDFLIPAGLYESRVSALEKVIAAGTLNFDVEIFMADERIRNREDAELIPYAGIANLRESDDDQGDPNLQNSGYETIEVEWVAGGGTMRFSPWEVLVVSRGSSKSPSRPFLSEDEKINVRDAITKIRESPVINDCFLFPVDKTRYTDYWTRIEVPMDLTHILNRVEANYYSCRLSVVADVKLIRENCVKYNHEYHELTMSANEMVTKFEHLVLSEEEVKQFEEVQKLVEESARQRQQPAGIDQSTFSKLASDKPKARGNTLKQSSLESLPLPSLSKQSQRVSRQSEGVLLTQAKIPRNELNSTEQIILSSSLTSRTRRRRQNETNSAGNAAPTVAATRRSTRNGILSSFNVDLEQPRQTLESLSSNGRSTRRGRSSGGLRRLAGAQQSEGAHAQRVRLSVPNQLNRRSARRRTAPSFSAVSDEQSASRRSNRARATNISYIDNVSDTEACNENESQESSTIPSNSTTVRGARRLRQRFVIEDPSSSSDETTLQQHSNKKNRLIADQNAGDIVGGLQSNRHVKAENTTGYNTRSVSLHNNEPSVSIAARADSARIEHSAVMSFTKVDQTTREKSRQSRMTSNDIHLDYSKSAESSTFGNVTKHDNQKSSNRPKTRLAAKQVTKQCPGLSSSDEKINDSGYRCLTRKQSPNAKSIFLDCNTGDRGFGQKSQRLTKGKLFSDDGVSDELVDSPSRCRKLKGKEFIQNDEIKKVSSPHSASEPLLAYKTRSKTKVESVTVHMKNEVQSDSDICQSKTRQGQKISKNSPQVSLCEHISSGSNISRLPDRGKLGSLSVSISSENEAVSRRSSRLKSNGVDELKDNTGKSVDHLAIRRGQFKDKLDAASPDVKTQSKGKTKKRSVKTRRRIVIKKGDSSSKETSDSQYGSECDSIDVSEDSNEEFEGSDDGAFSKNIVSRRMKNLKPSSRRQSDKPLHSNRNSKRSSRSRSNKSYVDPSSSESVSDADNIEIIATERKRKRIGSNSSMRSMKSAKRQMQIEVRDETKPTQKEWPCIDSRDIVEVAHAVLDRLTSLDEAEVFSRPVIEDNPQIAESYKSVIKKPMDFRTIREKQLCLYKSIQMFHRDLLLVFNNCIRYNGARSELGQLAKSMLEMLNDIFRDVCVELNVNLLRR